MSSKEYVDKTFSYNEEEIIIRFYKRITSTRMSKFLKELESRLSDMKMFNKEDQQLIHALLIIKHFTNYIVTSDSTIELLDEVVQMSLNGLLEQIVSEFEPKLTSDINELTLVHFLSHHKETPEYIEFKSGSKEKFLKIYLQNYIKNSNKKKRAKSDIADRKESQAEQKSTDNLLDEYNDYMHLYEIFGDEEYKNRAVFIMNVLKGKQQYDESFEID